MRRCIDGLTAVTVKYIVEIIVPTSDFWKRQMGAAANDDKQAGDQSENAIGGRLTKAIVAQTLERLGPKLLPSIENKLDAQGDIGSKMLAEVLRSQGQQLINLIAEAIRNDQSA